MRRAAAGVDDLATQPFPHANFHLPEVIGNARAYELTGNTTDANIADAFFGAARPLLDEARREALRTSFSEALPLGSAFEALFTAEERRDYALADFLDDVAAFRGRRGGGGMGGEEALAFLAFAQ